MKAEPTGQQRENQVLGPKTPTIAQLQILLGSIGADERVEAVTINGVAGLVIVETDFRGIRWVHILPFAV